MDEDFVRGWAIDQRRRGLMESTIYRRRDQVLALARWLHEDARSFVEVDEEDIQDFLDLRRNMGAKTRYTWLSTFACFYDFVVQNSEMTVNPVRAIIRPKLRRTLPRPISDLDLEDALEGSRGQYKVWLTLAAYAGLRCAEVAGVHRDDILWDINRLRVVGKGAKERLIPMHPLVAEELRHFPKPRTNGPIFHRPSGGPWPPDQLSREASVHLHAMGIDATMHQLRHWFGTRTYQACRDLRVVQELMGHSSPNTTAIYVAFSDEDQDAAVMALKSRTIRLAASGPPIEPSPPRQAAG